MASTYYLVGPLTKSMIKHHYCPHSEGMGKVMFSSVSVYLFTPGRGVTPHPADWVGGGGYPHARSGWDTPSPASQFRSQVRVGGYSQSRSQPEQHSVHLLHGRRYDSCVHVGLPCSGNHSQR